MNEVHNVRLTTNELRLMLGLLYHCRLGMANDSDLRVALHSLLELVAAIIPEDDGELGDRITFSREKSDGQVKVYGPESPSSITIEIL